MADYYREQLAFLEGKYEEVDGLDFYKEIFPCNEVTGELHSDFSMPNAIYLYKDEKDAGTKRRLRRRIMLDDTWEEDYKKYVQDNPMTLCSGLTYRRRANKLENAQQMNALVFDLDDVGDHELQNLFLRFSLKPDIMRTLPLPTYLVTSGRGLHLYYVFEEPIDLYPNIKLQMKALKHDLTFRMWDYKSTTQRKEIQYQSINQGFRMVGSINAKYGTKVRAFRTGSRVTLDFLNQYADHPKNKVDVNRPFRPSKITLAEAREKYPDWYQRVVVEKHRTLKKWDIAGKVHGSDPYALYHWWIRQAPAVKEGHRYYFLMCTVIYACKCDVPKKKLKEDMKAVFKTLQEIEHDAPLTEADLKGAMEVYSREYYNFTIKDIEKLTDLRIERNRRNGRKQTQHIKIMNAIRDIEYPDGEWRNKDGRPTAQAKVIEWRQLHLEGRKVDCIRDTGLSKKTVYKWWDYQKDVQESEG